LPQQEFPLQAMQLRLIETFLTLLSSPERLRQRVEPGRDLPTTPARVCKQRKQVGTEELSSRRAERNKALAHLCNAFFDLPHERQPRPLQDCPKRPQVWKSMLIRQDHTGL
jgi:hypothetical protein